MTAARIDRASNFTLQRTMGSRCSPPAAERGRYTVRGWSTDMEIMTRRLLLRDFTEVERPGFIAYHADPRYLALAGPNEEDPKHSQRLFQTFRDWTSEQPRRNYQLAILQRQEPQTLVGCCGLRGAGCEVGKAELGIEFAPDYWARHGYAIEVGRALLEFGFGDLGLQEIYSVTVDANARVARLAEWFGAEAVATRPGAAWMSARGWNETEWRITRDQWRRRGRITPRWT